MTEPSVALTPEPFALNDAEPECIVCLFPILLFEDFTRAPDGNCWHYRCRRAVDEAYARLAATGESGPT